MKGTEENRKRKIKKSKEPKSKIDLWQISLDYMTTKTNYGGRRAITTNFKRNFFKKIVYICYRSEKGEKKIKFNLKERKNALGQNKNNPGEKAKLFLEKISERRKIS